MGRARDIANVLSSSTNIALDSELGLSLITPTSVATSGGSSTISATGAVSFTSASAISLNGCFSSTYDNYKVLITKLTAASAANISFRFRAGGTDNSGGDYKNHFQGVYGSSGTTFSGGSNGTSSISNMLYLLNTSDGGAAYINLEVTNPFPATTTSGTWDTYAYQADTTVRVSKRGGFANTTQTSFDGFSLILNDSNITGSIQVYGYRK